MPVIYQTPSSNILIFKVVLISCSVLSAAILLTVTDFANHVPSIYSALVSWLRPPYLYLVINCIIISIVASSKLQSAKDDASPTDIPQPLDAMGIVPLQPVESIQTVDYPTTAEFKYDGVVVKDTSSYEVKVEKGLKYDAYERSDATRNQDLPVIVNAGDGGAVFEEDAMSNKENEYVMVKSMWTAPESNDLNEYSPSILKLPVSSRFSHRRNVKASPEGGRTVLGVPKSKRQNTLESTWKAITEGRQIPISRHLRKSDTWERDNHIHGGAGHQKPEKTMKKSDTFNQRSSTNSPSGVGEGSGKLRKEASLSQDELNRRVEAFIKKFNEEMRLQRQESLNQYMDMINRGSH